MKRPALIAPVLFIILTNYNLLVAQNVSTPTPSPYAHQSIAIGGEQVMLDYYRPKRRGRDLFGEGNVLYPYNQIWRTGANAGTKITFAKDVVIDGKPLAKGEYLIYTWPGIAYWEISFYNDLKLAGNTSAYDKGHEVLKMKVASTDLPFSQETHTVEIVAESQGYYLQIYFGKKLIRMPIQIVASMEIDPIVSIKQKLGVSNLQINYSAKIKVAKDESVGTWSQEHDGEIGGQFLNAGSYSIFFDPSTNKVKFDKGGIGITVIAAPLNENNGLLGNGSRLQISFHSLSEDNKTCGIKFLYNNKSSIIPLKIDHVPIVTKSIQDVMSSGVVISPGTYFSAAVYYFENAIDLNKSLEWIEKGVKDNSQYWVLFQKAKVLDAMGRYAEAKTACNVAFASAQQANNPDYQKLIRELSFGIDKRLQIAQIPQSADNRIVRSDYKDFDQKVALVIGVKDYQLIQPLQNSVNDAVDLSAILKAKGFRVIELLNPKSKREMQDAIRQYVALLETNKNSIGLLFYSGHGMQVKGSNYLIPTSANPKIVADMDDQCLNMDYIMSASENAGNDLNIFVLDACRNNPFRSVSNEGGLNMVNAPKGSYIVYATKPGSVASDGNGRNGLFTSKLIKWIDTPNLNIEQVFKYVAADVIRDSDDQQRPWIASDYVGDFYFTRKN